MDLPLRTADDIFHKVIYFSTHLFSSWRMAEFSYPYSMHEAQINCVSSIAWELFGCAKCVTLPALCKALGVAEWPFFLILFLSGALPKSIWLGYLLHRKMWCSWLERRNSSSDFSDWVERSCLSGTLECCAWDICCKWWLCFRAVENPSPLFCIPGVCSSETARERWREERNGMYTAHQTGIWGVPTSELCKADIFYLMLNCTGLVMTE